MITEIEVKCLIHKTDVKTSAEYEAGTNNEYIKCILKVFPCPKCIEEALKEKP